MSKKLYGLLGRSIEYSYSKKYFTNKFNTENLQCTYENFDVNTIYDLPELLNLKIHHLHGFNVTIPYKKDIFNYLDDVDKIAEKINAVNCVKIIDSNYLKGYNTDAHGFEKSLRPLLKKQHKKALILGTGGASKAVAYVLNKLNIDILFVSRTPHKNQVSYNSLSENLINEHPLIINTTPLGTSGSLEKQSPNIPYQLITGKHLLYDLIYNPSETVFLKKGKAQGALIKNGLEMLELQAEKSWEIWNND